MEEKNDLTGRNKMEETHMKVFPKIENRSPDFTQEEISFMSQVLSQITWKAGQRNGLILSESVIQKCEKCIDKKPTKVEEGEKKLREVV